MLVVLRLGHRIRRDKRITTHVALASRALGADGIFISGEKDAHLLEGVKDVTGRWGGDFFSEYRRDWKNIIKEYKEKNFMIVHLTFYGMPVQHTIGKLKGENLLVIVGGEKVPREVYYSADYNISVTNQPHSEISALAIFLHCYSDGRELEKNFENAKIRIIPREREKMVQKY